MILVFLALISQTIRHVYMLWIEPRGSVLDKYDKPRKSEIDAATSLDELMRRYEPVRKQVDEARQARAKAAAEPGAGSGVPPYLEEREEPFRSERELSQAIREWEQKSKEIRELWFFWTVGLVVLVLGMVLYRKNRWFGLTLIIAALAEFIYWTSPTFFGGTREFDRLLWNKLLFTLVSLVLLIIVIWINRVFATKDQPAASA